MPHISRVYDWIDADEAFAEQYTRARVLQGSTYGDRIGDIVDTLDDGGLSSEDVQAKRAAIDGLKWTSSRLAPKVYGDKVSVGVGGGQGPLHLHIDLSGKE